MSKTTIYLAVILCATALTLLLMQPSRQQTASQPTANKSLAPKNNGAVRGSNTDSNVLPPRTSYDTPRIDNTTVSEVMATLMFGTNEPRPDALLASFRANVAQARKSEPASLYLVFKTLQNCIKVRNFQFSMIDEKMLEPGTEKPAKEALAGFRSFCASAEIEYSEGIAHALTESANLGHVDAILDRARTTYGVKNPESWQKESLARLEALTRAGNVDAKVLLARSLTDGVHGKADLERARALTDEVLSSTPPGTKQHRIAMGLFARQRRGR